MNEKNQIWNFESYSDNIDKSELLINKTKIISEFLEFNNDKNEKEVLP